MNFEFTKKKLIISVVVMVVWYLFLVFIKQGFCPMYDCFMPPNAVCDSVSEFHLYPQCFDCSCPTKVSLLSILGELLVIIFPGLVAFVVYSFFDKKKKVKNEKVNKKRKQGK